MIDAILEYAKGSFEQARDAVTLFETLISVIGLGGAAYSFWQGTDEWASTVSDTLWGKAGDLLGFPLTPSGMASRVVDFNFDIAEGVDAGLTGDNQKAQDMLDRLKEIADNLDKSEERFP